MIVSDIMTTKLTTTTPDATLGHVVHLLRQHHFHHLPVVEHVPDTQKPTRSYMSPPQILIFKGLLTAQEVELAVALAQQEVAHTPLARPWQDRHVIEILRPTIAAVTPTTSVAAASQMLIERSMNCLPVIEPAQDGKDILVGLLTRSDILNALAQILGASEPGSQISIFLPNDHLAPLTKALQIADELHIHVSSVLVASQRSRASRSAFLRLSTINPVPFLRRLTQERIQYTDGFTAAVEEHEHASSVKRS